jgi:hypothetical protein
VQLSGASARAALSSAGASWSIERAVPPLVGMVELTPSGEAETDSIGYFFGPSGDFDNYLGAAIDPILIPIDQSARTTVFGVLADRQLRGGGAMALNLGVREIPAVRVAEQIAPHALVAEAQPLPGCLSAGLFQPCLVAGRSSAPGELDRNDRWSRQSDLARAEHHQHRRRSDLGAGPRQRHRPAQLGRLQEPPER